MDETNIEIRFKSSALDSIQDEELALLEAILPELMIELLEAANASDG